MEKERRGTESTLENPDDRGARLVLRWSGSEWARYYSTPSDAAQVFRQLRLEHLDGLIQRLDKAITTQRRLKVEG